MIRPLVITAAVLVASSAQAEKFDADKKALFISIVEKHGCKMHNLAPDPNLVNEVFTSGLQREDLRPIAQDMMAKGEAERQGEFLVLKTSACK